MGVDQLRVRHVPMPEIERGLAEDDELVLFLQQFLHPLDAVEPDQLQGAALVGELGGEALAALLSHHLHIRDAPAQLDVTAVFHNVRHLENLRLIHMTVWIVMQQVVKCVDVELLPKHLGALRSHTFQKFYRGLQDVVFCGHGCYAWSSLF